MKPIIPEAALSQHIAVLGKTGSGKTSTAKLIIEQVVAAGARVCILDPIKSDWWGLTSTADGKHAGLPFHILGGPRGHVPLHAGAGKAIGEIVASGSLPLSILDMADFAPGGQAQFFNDFAPVLLRKMRGVLYLVMEEAHIFAPKERSGIGAENMAIHYSKMLATAGRSKGIRLMVLTQRTQALHNALLGSCDTLIAHRFTAPADQEPIVKWLKANVEPEIMKQVSSSLSSLKTGQGWLCAGEARIFEQRQFPRIATYDNSATPTDNDEVREVITAPVDHDQLREIVGEAGAEIEANDPKLLKARIADLERELEKGHAAPSGATPAQLAEEYTRGREEGFDAGKAAALKPFIGVLPALQDIAVDGREVIARVLALRDKIEAVPIDAPNRHQIVPTQSAVKLPDQFANSSKPASLSTSDVNQSISKAGRAILATLAQYHPEPLTPEKLGILAGYTPHTGHFNNNIGALRSAGLMTKGWPASITPEGLRELGHFDPLPKGTALQEYWYGKLDKAGRQLLQAAVSAYPATMTKDQLGFRAGYEPNSGHFNNTLGRLRTMSLLEGKGQIKASQALFS